MELNPLQRVRTLATLSTSLPLLIVPPPFGRAASRRRIQNGRTQRRFGDLKFSHSRQSESSTSGRKIRSVRGCDFPKIVQFSFSKWKSNWNFPKLSQRVDFKFLLVVFHILCLFRVAFFSFFSLFFVVLTEMWVWPRSRRLPMLWKYSSGGLNLIDERCCDGKKEKLLGFVWLKAWQMVQNMKSENVSGVV